MPCNDSEQDEPPGASGSTSDSKRSCSGEGSHYDGGAPSGKHKKVQSNTDRKTTAQPKCGKSGHSKEQVRDYQVVDMDDFMDESISETRTPSTLNDQEQVQPTLPSQTSREEASQSSTLKHGEDQSTRMSDLKAHSESLDVKDQVRRSDSEQWRRFRDGANGSALVSVVGIPVDSDANDLAPSARAVQRADVLQTLRDNPAGRRINAKNTAGPWNESGPVSRESIGRDGDNTADHSNRSSGEGNRKEAHRCYFIWMASLILLAVSVAVPLAVVFARSDSDEVFSAAPTVSPTDGVMPFETKLTSPESETFGNFGISVAATNDRIVVGAPGHRKDSGAVYVFISAKAGWTQEAKLTASDPTETVRFGRSVAISEDTIVVGAPNSEDAGELSGSAYVFILTEDRSWTQEAKLRASDESEGDRFGLSVNISRDVVVIGSFRNDGNGNEAGAAYLFTRSLSGTWKEDAKLVASDGEEEDLFGLSVEISTDTVFVGSKSTDGRGSVYLFELVEDSWTQQQKLMSNDTIAGDRYAQSLAASRKTLVVGVPGDTGSGVGMALVYIWYDSVWSQQAKLVADDALFGDEFGVSVSIEDDAILVGTRADNITNAYLFFRNATIWSQQAKLTPTDGEIGDFFGTSVALAGESAVVGAWGDNDEKSDSGSAYVYDLRQLN